MSDLRDYVAILSKGENERVEFKESLSSLSAVREVVCAFADDISAQGASRLVLIGVNKEGRVVGVGDDDDTQQRLAQIRVDGSVTPTPSLTVERVAFDEKSIFVLGVQPSDSPSVRCSGTAYVWIGTVTTKATPEEERRLTEQRRSRALPFDARGLQGSSQHDLDFKRFQLDYLLQAVAEAVLVKNSRSVLGVRHGGCDWIAGRL